MHSHTNPNILFIRAPRRVPEQSPCFNMLKAIRSVHKKMKGLGCPKEKNGENEGIDCRDCSRVRGGNHVMQSAGIPKGPCRYMVYTWGPKGFPYTYFKGQVYPI